MDRNDGMGTGFNDTLEGNGLGFLYKKCKKIRANVLSKIALVPEYLMALKSYQGELTDESIYDLIRQEYLKLLASDNSYRTARDIVNKVSRDVKGSSSAWKPK